MKLNRKIFRRCCLRCGEVFDTHCTYAQFCLKCFKRKLIHPSKYFPMWKLKLNDRRNKNDRTFNKKIEAFESRSNNLL